MLVRDVLPLLRNWNVVIVDDLDNELWHGKWYEVPRDEGFLPLNVVMVDFDTLNDGFVVWVDK